MDEATRQKIRNGKELFLRREATELLASMERFVDHADEADFSIPPAANDAIIRAYSVLGSISRGEPLA